MGDQQIGVITEQGDMGLGFNPLSQEEQEVLQENKKETSDKENH